MLSGARNRGTLAFWSIIGYFWEQGGMHIGL